MEVQVTFIVEYRDDSRVCTRTLDRGALMMSKAVCTSLTITNAGITNEVSE